MARVVDFLLIKIAARKICWGLRCTRLWMGSIVSACPGTRCALLEDVLIFRFFPILPIRPWRNCPLFLVIAAKDYAQ